MDFGLRIRGSSMEPLLGLGTVGLSVGVGLRWFWHVAWGVMDWVGQCVLVVIEELGRGIWEACWECICVCG